MKVFGREKNDIIWIYLNLKWLTINKTPLCSRTIIMIVSLSSICAICN